MAGLMISAVAALLVLAMAPRAGAQELLFWDNWEGNPDSIAYSDINGLGGGLLNLGDQRIASPEGMAYDTVTNRLFVANSGDVAETGQITAINLDGSGASPFSAPGAPIESPEGIVVDPSSRTIYWINGASRTISWARLDGSAGGLVNTGAPVAAYRLALDPVAGRLYWYDNGPETIRYANVDNSGGGVLNTAGASPGGATNGIAVDPAGGRVFWLNDGPPIVSYALLSGAGAGDLPLGGAAHDVPYGLAFDPTLQRLYWANYGNEEVRTGALGFLDLNGIGGGINIATAPLDGPQDPLVIKSPSATGAPELARAANSREWLSCTRGEWGEDYPGSFVYRAPRTYAYQWIRDGVAIPGAAQPGFQATEPGSYGCAVTATNQAGSAVAASGAIAIARAKLKVLVKTKVKKTKRKKKATFRVQYYNQGDIRSAKPRVCVIVPKKLRKLLRAPKCKKLGRVNAKGRRATKLKVFVKPKARNKSYKLKFVVKGVPSKPSFGRVKVVGKG